MPTISRVALAALLVSCESFQAAEPGGPDGSASSSSSSSSGSSSSSSSSGSVAPRTSEVLAAGLSAPSGVSATNDGVYWTSIVPTDTGSSLRLHRCDLAGCGGKPAQLLDETTFQVTADAANVYWTNDNGIRACAIGPACQPRPILDGVSALGTLHAEAGQLYFTTSVSQNASLRRCVPDSCASTATELWSGDGIGAIAVSGDDVYFTAGQPSKTLRRARGAMSDSLGTLPGLPTSLAAIGTKVFIVANGTLYRCDAATACTPIPFASETAVFSASIHEGSVYFSVYGSGGTAGSIRRCSPDDCTSPAVVQEGGNPHTFAVHGEWIYFSDWGDGSSGSASIRRVHL